MYVGMTKGQSFAFKHFLSGNRFKFFTFISLWFYKSAGISQSFIANKVLCLHLFQCFSEAENDEMCQYVGQLLKDGEIDLSGQALSAVNIHTLGLFLDRSSIKHWRLLNLSNCYLGTQEIEQLFTFCSSVHINQLDVSYSNLTESSIGMLIKMLTAWKVRKAFLYSENGENMCNIINRHVANFPTDILVPFQTEIIPTQLSILIISKYSNSNISTLSVKNTYSSIHLLSCQLGNTINETNKITFHLTKISKRIYLYDCNTSFECVFESAMRCKSSSFHFVRESSISSETITCAVEKFAEFATTLGEDVLPLHVLTKKCFQGFEDFVYGKAHGTYVFRNCSHQEIVENFSMLSSQRINSRFVLKNFVKLSTTYVSTLFESNMSLKYLSLFDCRLQNHLMKMLSHVLKSLLCIFTEDSQSMFIVHNKCIETLL